MFGKRKVRLRVVFLLVSMSCVGIIVGQDSIPESIPQFPIETSTTPTDIIPETPAATEQPNETVTSSSETILSATPSTTVNTGQYVFEADLPQVVQDSKADAELLAALENNPFVLERDGKRQVGRTSMYGLPGYSSYSSTVSVETVELEKQVKEEEIIVQEEEEIFVPVDTSTAALNRLNPFRLEGTPQDRKTITLAKKIKFNPAAGTGTISTNELELNQFFDTSKVNVNPIDTLKLVVILFLLGLLTFIVASFRNNVTEVYSGFLNANILSLLHRDKGSIINLPYLSMYVLAACSFGTMIFLAVNLTGGQIFESNFWSIIVCILGVGLIFFLRHVSIALLASVFPFKKEIKLYGFTIAIFNFVMGIVLIPIVTLIAFAPTSFHEILLYFTCILFGFIYIFRTIRSIIIGNKYLINNKFHFFMYLCTIELAPLLILLKLIGY